jgi:hypothetical protein
VEAVDHDKTATEMMRVPVWFCQSMNMFVGFDESGCFFARENLFIAIWLRLDVPLAEIILDRSIEEPEKMQRRLQSQRIALVRYASACISMPLTPSLLGSRDSIAN